MGVATRVALSALAVLLLQLGAASARTLQTTSKEYIVKHDKHHGNICAFKADKQYTIHEFTTAFSIKWELVLELNEEWCKDRHIEHVPKGSLWYLPCDQHCAHIAHWHWKAEEKRSWKGDACIYKLDKDEHPRWVAYLFEVDWDVCLQLNPWVASRDKCEKEEYLWIPCYLKHKEKKESWHYSKERIPCDFSKPEPVHPPACTSHCPGHWPKWWNKPWCQKKDYKWEEDCKYKKWLCPEDKDDYEHPLECCKHDPYCHEHCPTEDDDNTGAPEPAPREPSCCKKYPKCSDKCRPAEDDDDTTGNAPSTAPPASPSPSPSPSPADPPVSEPADPPAPADDDDDDDDEEVPPPPTDDEEVPPPPTDDEEVPPPPADDEEVPPPPADDEEVPPPPADDEEVPPPPADDEVPPPPADDEEVPPPPADDEEVPPPPADDEEVPPPPADDEEDTPIVEEDSGDTSGIP